MVCNATHTVYTLTYGQKQQGQLHTPQVLAMVTID